MTRAQRSSGCSGFNGWIGSLAFGIMFAASPISTCLFKRFGHRAVTVVGVLLCSGGLLFSSFVPWPRLLFLTHSVLFGIGSNFIDNTSLNLVGAYFPRKNSARSTCFAALGWSIGSLGLNPGLEFLSNAIGWRNSFRVCSGGLFLIGMVSAVTFRPPPKQYSDILAKMERERQLQKLTRRESRTSAGSGSTAAGPSDKSGSKAATTVSNGMEYEALGHEHNHSFKHHLKNFGRAMKAPGIILWFIANICMNFSLVFPFVNMIKFMTTIGISEERGSFILTIVGVTDLIGRGSSAAFGDYLPIHSIYVYPISTTIMGVATFCLLYVKSIGGMYAFAVVVGLFTGIVNSMLFKACMDLFGSNILAESWTFTLLGAAIGISVGPTVAGAAYDYTRKFDIAFYTGGGVFILAAIVTLIIPFWQKARNWVPQVITKKDSSSSMATASTEAVDAVEETVEEYVWVV